MFPVIPGRPVQERRPQIPHRWIRQSRPLDAPTLDRLADCLLQRGFSAEAERLAWRAAALREAAQ